MPLQDIDNEPLFSYDFHHDPLRPLAVELAVEDLLPGTEVELTLGNGDDYFPSHDRALKVGVAVIFTGQVMLVTRDVFGCKLLQPAPEVLL